jgi:hypothetical protein
MVYTSLGDPEVLSVLGRPPMGMKTNCEHFKVVCGPVHVRPRSVGKPVDSGSFF